MYPTAEDVPEILRLTEEPQKRGAPQTYRIQYWEYYVRSGQIPNREVIGPLVGKTEHHVKNSIDFVQKIKGLEVHPSQKLVSFDVSAPFDQHPTEEATRVIRQRLEQDHSWQDRTNLNADQVMQLLELCLNTTYFTCRGEFFKQYKATAMGSPIRRCKRVYGTF